MNNKLVYQGYLINDLKKMKDSCPLTLNASFICKMLYFMNLQRINQNYRLAKYRIDLKQITDNKLMLTVMLLDQADQFSFTVLINRVNAGSFLSFLSKLSSLALINKQVTNYVKDAYFSDLKLKGHITLPIDLSFLLEDNYASEDIINFNLTKHRALYLNHINTIDNHNEKQIDFKFDLANMMEGDAEVSFFIPNVIYVLPMLDSLEMTDNLEKSFENQAYFDYLSFSINQFILTDNLLINYALPKSLVLQSLQERVTSYAKTQYQKHRRDFLEAVSLFLSDPGSFQTVISAKYSFHHTDDFWHYFVRLISSNYRVKLYEKTSGLIKGDNNFDQYKVAKKNLLKYKLRLKHFYLKDIQFDYTINGKSLYAF
ncbi:hypothetical protein L3V83_11740 [Thiotrichales bacterium 19X7-9]|nr:hypothetical protein [Thiotrichales bacterium 19X7-9]